MYYVRFSLTYLPTKKADGQAFRSTEVQKSTREFSNGLDFSLDIRYCKVASSNTSRLEAHAGFFRLLMKGIFDLYVV